MPKVFISHSWEDNEISKKLAEFLKRDGAEIWIDCARISGGESLPDRISEALEWCDTLLLLWSDSAASSYYVGLEWKCALDLQKKIIPCVIDNTKRPAILRSFLYLDFKDVEQDYKNLVRTLKLSIKKIDLRSNSTQLSLSDVTEMLKEYDFFDSNKHKSGRGFNNLFELQTIKGDKIVIDRASCLMWQRGGSLEHMEYEKAKEWIEKINRKGYVGFHDWRLPTLEEAMSLMEPKLKRAYLFIDPVFDDRQIWIWTSDLVKGELQTWVVSFFDGNCRKDYFDIDHFVRAVRSG